ESGNRLSLKIGIFPNPTRSKVFVAPGRGNAVFGERRMVAAITLNFEWSLEKTGMALNSSRQICLEPHRSMRIRCWESKSGTDVGFVESLLIPGRQGSPCYRACSSQA
ncbi:MAG: hypothetical protein AAFV92_08505, partial [Pseudomonadota bacterium]